LVEQKSVIIDGVVQDNVKQIIRPKDGQLLKVGKKRFYRLSG
jgi:hypothetical protein